MGCSRRSWGTCAATDVRKCRKIKNTYTYIRREKGREINWFQKKIRHVFTLAFASLPRERSLRRDGPMNHTLSLCDKTFTGVGVFTDTDSRTLWNRALVWQGRGSWEIHGQATCLHDCGLWGQFVPRSKRALTEDGCCPAPRDVNMTRSWRRHG